jgi:hypothetical protein
MMGANAVAVRTSNVECSPEVGSSTYASAAPPPAPEPAKPAAPAAPAPNGGAGFELGAEVEATRTACEGAGHTFQTDGEKTATCSGPVAPLGFAAKMSFKVCSGKLCSIVAEHRPEADWIGAIAELRSKLEKKYGPPAVRDGEIPFECRTKEAFTGCLARREIRLRYGWTWSTGQSINLTVGAARAGEQPAIRIDWAKPIRSLAVNDSAL